MVARNERRCVVPWKLGVRHVCAGQWRDASRLCLEFYPHLPLPVAYGETPSDFIGHADLVRQIAQDVGGRHRRTFLIHRDMAHPSRTLTRSTPQAQSTCTTITTRLFFARPTVVALLATATAAPRPLRSMRSLATPLSMRICATASARRSESALL